MGADATMVPGVGRGDQPQPAIARADGTARPAVSARPQAAQGQLAPGTLLNSTHRIDGLVAIGGMGEVYRATNLANGDVVALKTMRPDVVRDPRIAELFRREGSALRRLRDPAIVFYEGTFISETGLLYLVMEFVDGPSLAEVVRDKPLSVDQVRQLRDRLAGGLAHAHEQGIVHRDLSPQNVILPRGQLPEAKLIDFGIAKQQAAGQTTVIGRDFAGKIEFAAPEQFGLFGGAVDGRTDIYSLGLVLAYAATGRALDMGDSLASAVEARHRVPDLAGVPAELRAEIATMLAPDPAKRPQTARAIIAKPEPVLAPAPPRSARGSAIGLGLAIAAVLAWLLWEKHATSPEVSYPLAAAQLVNQGMMRERGQGVAQNYGEAVRLYRLAADQGNADGQVNLARMFEFGRWVVQDYPEAVRLYRLAADQGNAAGQVNLGRMYQNGLGIAQNPAEAARLYRLAADQGNTDAQVDLGWMYDHGTGVAQNAVEAVRLYRLAADRGDAFGQVDLGVAYQNGRGVAQNLAEAVRLYRLAADQGNAFGELNLGRMYENGLGIAQNLVEAVRLYRLSADQGDAVGQIALGLMYENGRGIAQSDVEAVRLYRLAADQGYAGGQIALGRMYENGRGVARSREQAIEWYRRAAQQGDQVAIDGLRRLGVRP
jgi:TPR repeat protein